MTEDEMVGWHYQFSEHEFEQTPGDSEGQGSLACCSSRSNRVRHDLVTEQHKISSLFINGLFIHLSMGTSAFPCLGYCK